MTVSYERRKARGQALAKAMKSKGFNTQIALARKSGTSQATIGRLVRGEVDPRASTLMDICRVLSISPDVILNPPQESKDERQ